MAVVDDLRANPAVRGLATKSRPDGAFDYTLTSLLSVFLADLEEKYGPRDETFTPIGIEVGGEFPTTWFPSSGKDKHVIIRLSALCIDDPGRAIYQLAHEAVHLLAPNKRAPVVEEGLATIYQLNEAPKWGSTTGLNDDRYARAKALVVQANAAEPEFVRRLRLVEPSFVEWTPDLFHAHLPHIGDKLAKKLCTPFCEMI